MTTKEEKAIQLTVELLKALADLEVIYKNDLQEHYRDIHNIQNRIMMRTEFKERQK